MLIRRHISKRTCPLSVIELTNSLRIFLTLSQPLNNNRQFEVFIYQGVSFVDVAHNTRRSLGP
jgi:hypothetical protein